MSFNFPSCTGLCDQGREPCTCMNQREGGECIKDGRPVAEMACAEPEPEPSFWRALFDFLTAPKFTP